MTKIRTMTDKDVGPVVSIAKECADGRSADMVEGINAYPELAWSEDSFYKEVRNPKSVAIVAETGGEVVGYLCARVILGECHLQNIAVKVKVRGSGIGKALMDDLFMRLSHLGVHKVFLELRKGNLKAVRLYETMGFRVVAIRKDYYINPTEDGLMMVNTLRG